MQWLFCVQYDVSVRLETSDITAGNSSGDFVHGETDFSSWQGFLKGLVSVVLLFCSKLQVMVKTLAS
jgi:hypothetical protein